MEPDISARKIVVSIVFAIVTWFIMWLYTEITSDDAIQSTGFSVVLPGEEMIHRGPEHPEELVYLLPGQPDLKTLYDNYEFATKTYPNNQCYGWKEVVNGKAGPYQWITYKEANTAAEEFAAGMAANDMMPTVDNMRMLAIFSKNRLEWVIADRACVMHSGTTIPLYDTLTVEVIAYILNQTNVCTIVCSKSETPKLISIAGQCPSLKHIVQMEPPTQEEIAHAEKAKVRLQSFESVKQLGKNSKFEKRRPKPTDVATFCYTSGTTGMPKGVLLTHQNLISALAGAHARGITTTSAEVHLSFLPLAHVMERIIQVVLINTGGSIGFYQGDTLKLAMDLAELRPTIFPCVPRLLNRVYDKIIAGASASAIKKFLFTTGIKQKTKIFRETGRLTHTIWDKLVFNKVAKKLGLDRCRFFVTGSAPISTEVMDFFRVVFSAAVVEGYGQSETASAGTLTSMRDISSSHIGGPTPNMEIKLVDVPEMGYFKNDTQHDLGVGNVIPCNGRGEICLRGPSVFKGYYKLPDKTAETIDKDGWCHTGDVGIWLVTGQLKIVDRIKNIFKLSQGEYVAAEKVENVYATCQYVAQSFVYGDSLKSCVVAVVVPDFDMLTQWAKENGKSQDHSALTKDKDAAAHILKEMTSTGKSAKLHGFELAKAVHLVSDPFSAENDLLTPSFKLKRHQALKVFRTEIDRMYAALN